MSRVVFVVCSFAGPPVDFSSRKDLLSAVFSPPAQSSSTVTVSVGGGVTVTEPELETETVLSGEGVTDDVSTMDSDSVNERVANALADGVSSPDIDAVSVAVTVSELHLDADMLPVNKPVGEGVGIGVALTVSGVTLSDSVSSAAD